MVRPVENLRKRKSTGGRRPPHRGRRAYERDGYSLEPLRGERLGAARRVRGGGRKLGLRRTDVANVLDPATQKVQKTRIVRVLANPANRDYERRGIMTKGAIIETELGRARILSRPSQDAVVNAVLLK